MTKIQNSKQIKSHSNAELAKIFQKQNVVLAYLFGSQAKGKIGPLSDIDIAVYFDESVHANKRFNLRLEALGELIDLFNTDDINLVVLNDAPPLLAQNLKRGNSYFF